MVMNQMGFFSLCLVSLFREKIDLDKFPMSEKQLNTRISKGRSQMRKMSSSDLRNLQPHVSLFIFRAQKSAGGLVFQKKGFSDSSLFPQNRRPVQDSLSTVRLNGVSPSQPMYNLPELLRLLPPPLMPRFHHTQFVMMRNGPSFFFVLARHYTNRLASIPSLLLSGFDIFVFVVFFFPPSFGQDLTTQPRMPHNSMQPRLTLGFSVLVLQAQAYYNTWLGTKC